VHASDVYGALAGVPGVASAHLEEMDRAGNPAAGASQFATDRIEIPGDAVAVWAPPLVTGSASDVGFADDGLALAWEEAGEP
jgi:hypothetical protein